MKRLVWLLVLTGALFAGGVPEASAHGSNVGSHIAYDRHYVVRHGHSYPRWLRRHDDFHRWYWRSHFRNDYYLSWNRLYDIYRYERKYRRSYRYSDYRGRHRHHGHHRRH